MTALRNKLMTAEEFYAWAEGQEENFELFDGEPVAMSPERVAHGDTKFQVVAALRDAIQKAAAPCRAVLDSAAVRIDTRSSYQPDALVYCGDRVAGTATIIPNPIVVVEVLSPSNAVRDMRDKLRGYFRVPSIQHYLIVDPDERLVIKHTRTGSTVTTDVLNEGVIVLDPPGLTLSLESLFPPRE